MGNISTLVQNFAKQARVPGWTSFQYFGVVLYKLKVREGRLRRVVSLNIQDTLMYNIPKNR